MNSWQRRSQKKLFTAPCAPLDLSGESVRFGFGYAELPRICGIPCRRKTAGLPKMRQQWKIFPDDRDLLDGIVDKQTALQVHQILHRIEEPYKEVFSLRVFGELTFREIGDLFGKREHWACVTYHRAKAKILNQMGGKL